MLNRTSVANRYAILAASLEGDLFSLAPGEEETLDDVRLRMEMGRLYLLVDRYEKAADCFARSLSMLENPELHGLGPGAKRALNASTYIMAGNCYLLMKRTKEAIEVFDKAYALDHDQGGHGYNIARAYVQQGRFNDALPSLEAYFKQNLAEEGYAPYRLLAEILKGLGKSEELPLRLEKLRLADSKNVPLGYFLADQYREKEQFSQAEALYKAMLSQKASVTGYAGLAAIYRKTKRAEPLLSALGQSLRDLPALDALGEELPVLAGDKAMVSSLAELARQRAKSNPTQLDEHGRQAIAELAEIGRASCRERV